MLNCVYSNCVYWDGVIKNCDDAVKPISNWFFSKMECSGDLDYSTTTFPAYIEKISTTTNDFYLQKTISYGDYLVVAFLILIFIGLVVAGMREFAKNRKLERL